MRRATVNCRSRRWATGVVLVCSFACAVGASAHPEFSPITTNRYVKVDLVAGDELRLAYTVMYGAQPAYAERKRADVNADGKLDDAESRAMGERLRAEVTAHLGLELDGKKLTAAFETPVVGLAGAEVGPSPFSVDLVARIASPDAAPHTLVVDDQTELPQLGESELRVEESPRTRLLEAHRGRGPGPREPRIVFRGPKFSALEDRTITIKWEGARAPVTATETRPPSQRLGLLAAAGLALLALLLVVWRAKKRA